MKLADMDMHWHRTLGDDAAAMDYAHMAFRAMVAERVVPIRPAPTGGESAFLASYKGNPVGLATFYPTAETGVRWIWLDLLYVAPDARGNGLARALVALVKADARNLGITHVRFGVKLDNDPMLALAARLGFGSESLNFIGTA